MNLLNVERPSHISEGNQDEDLHLQTQKMHMIIEENKRLREDARTSQSRLISAQESIETQKLYFSHQIKLLQSQLQLKDQALQRAK